MSHLGIERMEASTASISWPTIKLPVPNVRLVALSAIFTLLAAFVPFLPDPTASVGTLRKVTQNSPTEWLERKTPKPGSFVLNV